ncbi:hypothetical protein UFOVP823_53 [uncultured Caudovirales phage]|uniref:Uncharacterized protein n=1 Tax=uncultured Caudovirales phage TaxID=2100421 RepID=A0A6J5P8E1_9CAUD|nr:hypothetical protein UFOVP823_53 [uncultured Caudovirales phage]
MPSPKATPKSTIATPVAKVPLPVPGLTPRDLFFYHLGITIYLAQHKINERKVFVLAAPDEETRLLGEVALEFQIETLTGTDAARKIAERIVIKVGGVSTIRNVNANPLGFRRSGRIH